MQFLLNAMNANTAAIAQGYAEGVTPDWNSGLRSGLHAASAIAATRRADGSVLLTAGLSLQPGPDRVLVCCDRVSSACC